MSLDIDGKTILVTGGTGSFGQCFVETVLVRHNPHKVIVFSRDELKQFEMRHKDVFKDDDRLRFFIGDVRSVERLEMAFRSVDLVVHAAALKQISVAEYNPFECIQTNVHGAENVVTAAIRTGVNRVMALSTDKAANPINLYGASKLASDKIFVAAKHLVGKGDPLFGVARYGNVIGSRGSVVPHFRQLIDGGARKLPITDLRMTRFWLTLQQGVEFVLSCFEMMQGGEIFVPKIPSMKVMDLAKTMSSDVELHEVGIRPGEKLHEVMITEDDARSTVELPDRFIIRPTIYGEHRLYDQGERPVAEGFRYSSDNNDTWLSPADLSRVLMDLATPTQTTTAE